jgi:prepilin-type N-terminal cleavage/methylation domain-containing protein
MSKGIRRGFSLIELVTVMGVVTVLMSLLAMFLSATLRNQRQAMLRQRQRTEFARLDGILRADVHAAASVNLKSVSECELKNDQGTRWTYRSTEEGLVRERWLDDRLRQREVFFLRPGMEVNFSTRKENERPLLVLELDLPTAAQGVQAKQQPYLAEILIGGGLAAPPKTEEQP